MGNLHEGHLELIDAALQRGDEVLRLVASGCHVAEQNMENSNQVRYDDAYVYMYIYICVYIHIYDIFIHIYIYTYIHIYIHIYIYIYIYIYLYNIQLHLYTYIVYVLIELAPGPVIQNHLGFHIFSRGSRKKTTYLHLPLLLVQFSSAQKPLNI